MEEVMVSVEVDGWEIYVTVAIPFVVQGDWPLKPFPAG
jgi:hypothetical protein